VLEAADPADDPLDPHAEARMRHRPKPPQIEVPLERFLGQVVVLDSLQKQIVTRKTLAATDDFADAFRSELVDAQRQLLAHVTHRMAGAETAAARVRAWVRAVIEQARNPAAADNTRQFAINNARLADRFPAEVARSRELLVRPLRDAVADAGGDPKRDADAIYHLAIGCMNDALVARRRPTAGDVEHLEQFVLGGLRGT